MVRSLTSGPRTSWCCSLMIWATRLRAFLSSRGFCCAFSRRWTASCRSCSNRFFRDSSVEDVEVHPSFLIAHWRSGQLGSCDSVMSVRKYPSRVLALSRRRSSSSALDQSPWDMVGCTWAHEPVWTFVSSSSSASQSSPSWASRPSGVPGR